MAPIRGWLLIRVRLLFKSIRYILDHGRFESHLINAVAPVAIIISRFAGKIKWLGTASIGLTW